MRNKLNNYKENVNIKLKNFTQFFKTIQYLNKEHEYVLYE